MSTLPSGVSMVSVKETERAIRKKDSRLFKNCFTPAEIRYCKGKRHAAEHFAGRLAAKEACLKALARPVDASAFKKVEVTRKASGQPYLKVHPSLLRKTPWKSSDAHLSMAHERDEAVAFVLFAKPRVSHTSDR